MDVFCLLQAAQTYDGLIFNCAPPFTPPFMPPSTFKLELPANTYLTYLQHSIYLFHHPIMKPPPINATPRGPGAGVLQQIYD